MRGKKGNSFSIAAAAAQINHGSVWSFAWAKVLPGTGKSRIFSFSTVFQDKYKAEKHITHVCILQQAKDNWIRDQILENIYNAKRARQLFQNKHQSKHWSNAGTSKKSQERKPEAQLNTGMWRFRGCKSNIFLTKKASAWSAATFSITVQIY